jgi:hypothetical protein
MIFFCVLCVFVVNCDCQVKPFIVQQGSIEPNPKLSQYKSENTTSILQGDDSFFMTVKLKAETGNQEYSVTSVS